LIGTAVSVLGALITLAATGADMVSLVMLTVIVFVPGLVVWQVTEAHKLVAGRNPAE